MRVGITQIYLQLIVAQVLKLLNLYKEQSMSMNHLEMNMSMKMK